MGKLKNVKRERFAQELAKGNTQVEAYKIAGYSPNDSNAAKLANKPEIQERITEINGKALARAELEAELLLPACSSEQAKPQTVLARRTRRALPDLLRRLSR
jgi:phage terminase small subunit